MLTLRKITGQGLDRTVPGPNRLKGKKTLLVNLGLGQAGPSVFSSGMRDAYSYDYHMSRTVPNKPWTKTQLEGKTENEDQGRNGFVCFE